MELIGRFIKRISGEAAREKEELRQRREAQNRFEEEMRRKEEERLRARKEAIAKAIAVDPAIKQKLYDDGYPQENLGVQEEIARIEATVKARWIHGKHLEVTMKGVHFPPAFVEYRDDGDISSFISKQKNIDREAGESFYLDPLFNLKSHTGEGYPNEALDQEMAQKTFLSMVNHPSGADSVLFYSFPTVFLDAHRRLVPRVDFYFLLPKEEAHKLLSLVRKNPDTAETFFQKAAEGVDREKKALGRYSTQLAIINLDKFNIDNLLNSRLTKKAIAANANGEIERFSIAPVNL